MPQYTHTHTQDIHTVFVTLSTCIDRSGGPMTVQMTTELLLMAAGFQYIRICAGKMVCSLPTLLPPHWAPAVWLQCVKRSRTVFSFLSSHNLLKLWKSRENQY